MGFRFRKERTKTLAVRKSVGYSKALRKSNAELQALLCAKIANLEALLRLLGRILVHMLLRIRSVRLRWGLVGLVKRIGSVRLLVHPWGWLGGICVLLHHRGRVIIDVWRIVEASRRPVRKAIQMAGIRVASVHKGISGWACVVRYDFGRIGSRQRTTLR